MLTMGFALTVLTLLACAVAGGLLRAGIALPAAPLELFGPSAAHHAFLMISAFMGTVIGLERAVAFKHRLAFIGPLCSALAGVLLLAGWTALAAALGVLASLAFVIINALLVKRQPAAHTAVLTLGAVAWALSCVWFATGTNPTGAIACGFGFLILTIVAERLEMTRLTRRHDVAARLLFVLIAWLFMGMLAPAQQAAWSGTVYGSALMALAIWLITFDIARRTLYAQPLARYMAICLLLGYAWLLVAGAAWIATSWEFPLRDLALHALGLGFVFSMMMGHAPVILPAIARVKVRFGWAYYLPLALLHASLAVRVIGGAWHEQALSFGAVGNALALIVFIATVVGSAVAWHFKGAPSRAASHHGHLAEH